MPEELQFDPLYPDVLGAITGGSRINLESLQIAVGVFPRQAYLNQPIEIIVIVQSLIDQPIQAKIAIQLPIKSADGQQIQVSAPQKMFEIMMKPGEVGVLRMPIIAEAPTPPGDNYPVRVAIRHRPVKPGQAMRSPAGGAPASVLAVSPFKLQVLRDVEYILHVHTESPENLVAQFDIAPKVLPPHRQPLKPTYEVLWTAEAMPEERQMMAARMDEARMIASNFTRVHLFEPLARAVDERYAANGLPLHPGETSAIAKMLTYTLDDSLSNDPAYKIEDLRWFQALCQALAYDPTISQWDPGEIVTRFLMDAAFYDATLTGFRLIRPRVRVNLGDRAERIKYANRLLGWLSGQNEPDVIYIYLPLTLGGLCVNSLVTGRGDDAWGLLDDVREAYRGRIRLASGSAVEVFDMVDKLLERAEDDLRRARILPE
ncbi:hypothetical protein QQ056_19915 [Oscillatoria laete-virens NRMC-F 0139]|nr:hypothetical protein [Oscillatoria laete-virens]MDL5055799.1 hypothetical protein [Oscillatoria laete-virens NRMC-F 0139]